jgi:glycosyltransferase involved in cell wall biosynthesis
VRILYLNPTASMGGAEGVLLEMLRCVRRARPSWTVGLIVGNEGALAAEARQLGVETMVLPLPRPFARLGDAGLDGATAWRRFAGHTVTALFGFAAYARTCSRAMQAFRPTIVHSNGFKMHLVSALCKPRGATLIWHVHDYLHSRQVARRLMRWLKWRCDAIVAVSNSVAGDVRAALGSAPPVTTIWNSIDSERFACQGPAVDLDRLAGLAPAADGTVRVGLLATFGRWKGHLLFLEAVQAVRRNHLFRAYIIGGPVYETLGSQISVAELRAAVDRLGLSDAVGLTGFIADAPTALRSLDVVVHASTEPEPFGLVIAEGMACGRAVIMAGDAGAAELIDAEVSALAYERGSAHDLARQLERVIADPSLRRRLGAAATPAAQERFATPAMETRLLALYGRLREARAT